MSESTGERPLYPGEKEFLQDWVLPRAEEKLNEIGIQNPKDRLPKAEQFIIHEYKNPYSHQAAAQAIGGFVHEFGQNIIIEPPEGISLTHATARGVLFHEIAHFVTPRVIGRNRLLAWGFQRYMETGAPYGIYEEPSAEIFSLYCLDSSKAELPIHYTISTPFLISLLTKFAEKVGLTPLDVFKQFFKAKLERDFSFQQKLVKSFGKDFVKGLNNIREGETFDLRNKFDALSIQGEFQDEYSYLQKEMDEGKKVHFPGIKGKLQGF